MASHTNHAGYSNEGEDAPATPYNRPRPQWEMKSSAPVVQDPTAALLAEGGFLTLNDRDRAGLNKWFQDSFEGRFEGGVHSWFQESFKNQYRPIRDRINKIADTAFNALRKNEKDITKLRGEHEAEVTKLRGEVAGLRKAFDAAEMYLNGMTELIDKNNKEIAGLRTDMTAEIIKMHKTMAAEVVKIHASTRHEMRDFISSKNKEFKASVGELRGSMLSKHADSLSSMKEDLLASLRGELTTELIKMQRALKPASRSRPASKPSKVKNDRTKPSDERRAGEITGSECGRRHIGIHRDFTSADCRQAERGAG